MKLSTKDKLIVAAKALFWKFGVKKVTVEEICEEAKLSKMTFYRNFKNKTEIIVAVLDKFVEKNLKKSRDIMYCDRSFMEKIEGLIALKLENMKGTSFEFIKEIATQEDNDLIVYLSTFKQSMQKEMFEWYATAQKNGDIRADIDLRMLDYYSNAITKMSGDEYLLQIHGSPENVVKELITFFFYGISASKNQKN